ncbi:MAG: hypothetical protein II951_09290 [Bacteroidales bacterium]|nr:hypothetical protein [Bacteroidales bacterium]
MNDYHLVVSAYVTMMICTLRRDDANKPVLISDGRKLHRLVTPGRDGVPVVASVLEVSLRSTGLDLDSVVVIGDDVGLIVEVLVEFVTSENVSEFTLSTLNLPIEGGQFFVYLAIAAYKGKASN